MPAVLFRSGCEDAFVLAKQRQAPAIFRLISEIDPHAFVSQSAVIGVYGEGLTRLNIKQKEHGV